mmetsp:Transcript_41407/g.95236  ORF Transcript_41407/g.95236 Transcript_41407/m.95236 type:complete len:119 (-) Transcript_41407:47-403(-)
MAQQIVSPRRLLEGLVYTTILVCVGGFVLRLCGDGYREAKRFDKASMILGKIVPFPDKEFQFNFTHVLLFSALVALLSMFHHPAQDVIEQEAEKESKKAAKKEKKKAEKEKEAKKAKA